MGFLSPPDKDRIINRAQYEYFDKIKPAFGINQQINDALLPFKKEQTFSNGTSPSGVITLNADYLHLLAIETVVSDSDGTHYIPVEMIGEDELSIRRNSQLIPLNVYNPVGRLISPSAAYGQYRIQLYPMSASAGDVYYLRKPYEVSFSYTTTGRTITYNQGTSIQMEWNEPSINKIIFIALQSIGINIQDISLTQFTQAKEAQS